MFHKVWVVMLNFKEDWDCYDLVELVDIFIFLFLSFLLTIVKIVENSRL